MEIWDEENGTKHKQKWQQPRVLSLMTKRTDDKEENWYWRHAARSIYTAGDSESETIQPQLVQLTPLQYVIRALQMQPKDLNKGWMWTLGIAKGMRRTKVETSLE